MNTGDETRDHHEPDPVGRACDAYSREWKNGCGRPVEDFLRAHGLNPSELPPNLVPELEKLRDWYGARLPAPPTAGRYAPGTLINNRYQIEVVLGEGGMGVVYRAFDMKLEKTVALKFLPPRLAANPALVDRFHKEVRTAQDVSHRCVARVYDIDDHDDHPFFSMEYIDGCDLASLLKRSGGRLTEETAARYARQLCLGLAAIHSRGHVHRDLKPQNVMIDREGQLRVTDFGLAVEGTEAERAGIAGTLPYMSPEQARGQATKQSDIYSLGLVLYEMFTGCQAFESVTLEQLVQRKSLPAAPSAHVASLPTEVDTAVLQCIEPEPAKRPERVQNVLHMLLRAGGTPTPEEVAVAEPPQNERTGGLSLRAGIALFGLTVCCLFLVGELNDHTALFRQALTDWSPRDLTRKAREHLNDLGFAPESTRDTAHGLATDEALLAHLRNGHSRLINRNQLPSGQPAVMYFWYRRSPDVIAQRLAPNDTSGWSMPGRVLPSEPPLREPGEVCAFLDLNGRLIELHAVPARRPPNFPVRVPDPTRLLKAAGFENVPLSKADAPTRAPTGFADIRMAWVGAHPQAPEVVLRIEAAYYQGEPVYFHVGPEAPQLGDRLPGFMPDNLLEKVQEVKNTLLGLVALPIGVWFAWRNWIHGRAHPRGALILAGGFVLLGLAGWVLAAHHVLWPRNRLDSFKDELSMFTGMLGRVVFDGVLLWLAYLALEPWVRRTDPERVSSWNRLIQGRWRAPSVGGDILLGCAGAAGFVSLLLLARAIPGWLGYVPDLKSIWDATYTEGAGSLLVTLQIALMVALRGFFLYFLVLLLCRGYVRFGVCLNVAIWWGLYAHGGDYTAVHIAVGLAYAIACFFVLRRAGLLGFIAFTLVEQVLTYMPVTTDFSVWYGAISTMSLAFVLALALYGTWTVGRAQQPADKT